MLERYKRTTNSLFGRQFQHHLLDEIVWVRSENLSNFSDFYVDTNHLEAIDNNEDHLITGRRGTGKTHLLGAFHERVSRRRDEVSVLTSLVDVGYQTSASNNPAVSTSPKHVARQIFLSFLSSFSKNLIDEMSPKLRFLGETTRKNAEDNLQNLLQEITIGSPETITVEGEIYQTANDGSAVSKDTEFEVGLALDGVKFGGSRKTPSGTKESDVPQDNTVRKIIYRTNFYNVRRFIKQAMKFAEVRRVHILIDEWMELDKKSDSSIQSEFAQLVKACFLNESAFSVKIASIWGKTFLHDRNVETQARGMQVGHDIIHSVDLDSSFFSSEREIQAFVKLLLYKRLVRKVPAIMAWEIEDDQIDDVIITELFDGMKEFNAFVAAGHGIPRDLMRLFEKSFQKIRANFVDYSINSHLVIDVAQNIYAAHKRDVIAPNLISKQQWSLINRYMEETQRRYFIADHDSIFTSSSLRALVDHELIHEVPSTVLPREIRRNHKVYMIDFGTFVDWKKAIHAPVDEIVEETLIPVFTGSEMENVSDFQTKIIVDQEIWMSCISCCKTIERESPVVTRHNICPLCGDEAA